jgi:allantoate deiminase
VERPQLADRVLLRLEELFAIGGGPGANRPGLGDAEAQACALAARWMEAAGLIVSRDAAGNLYGRVVGSQPDLPEVWTGSHLDTVPQGGRFDGALGVVAAIEAVARLRALERTVTVVAFRDEEGVRFGGGCFGSRALCGRLDPDELEKRDADGITVRQALTALGLGAPPAEGWLDGRAGCFVEVHVEQGPRLADAGTPLGVVTAIVGTSGTGVAFIGRPGHAGATSMRDRSDALVAAAEFVLRVRELALERGAVATVGQLSVDPGAANVIPGRVTLTVDARAPEKSAFLEFLAAIEDAAEKCARRYGSSAETARRWLYEPVPMAAEPRAALLGAARELDCEPVELVSLAGHDSAVLAQAGVPSAMLFVRSGAGGVSHCPEEWSDERDVSLAVDALSRALRTLATGT